MFEVLRYFKIEFGYMLGGVLDSIYGCLIELIVKFGFYLCVIVFR